MFLQLALELNKTLISLQPACWLSSFITNCLLLLPTLLAGDARVTPALRWRHEGAERQRSFIREQQETAAILKPTLGSPDEGVADGVYNASQNSFILD
jgi:hypothetical protein